MTVAPAVNGAGRTRRKAPPPPERQPQRKLNMTVEPVRPSEAPKQPTQDYTMPLEVFANHFIQPRLDALKEQVREDQKRFASEILARVITELRTQLAKPVAAETKPDKPPKADKKAKKRKHRRQRT